MGLQEPKISNKKTLEFIKENKKGLENDVEIQKSKYLEFEEQRIKDEKESKRLKRKIECLENELKPKNITEKMVNTQRLLYKAYCSIFQNEIKKVGENDVHFSFGPFNFEASGNVTLLNKHENKMT